MVVGIVAEFNPLHNGHAHLINKVRQMGAECVIASLSGNFVQRGDVSIISKFARAEAALKCGIDLCLELPVVYSMSTAQNFAFGAVYALCNAGVDTIAFGSETADTDLLIKISNILDSHEFIAELESHLSKGCAFPFARQKAVENILGKSAAEILQNPNDNLGVEYIYAAKKIKPEMKFIAVKRIGADHDQESANSVCPSASYIRKMFLNNNTDAAKDFMPEAAYQVLEKEFSLGRIGDIQRLETAILATLRATPKEKYSMLPDISEGIENRLYDAVKGATSLNELYYLAKTKRYSHARIRRLALSAFLGFDNEFFLSPPPYVRILGHTSVGREQLKHGFKDIPAFSRVGEITQYNNPAALKMFNAECRASDIYELSLEKPSKCGKEFLEKIIAL